MTASRSVEVRIPLRWADMDAYGHVNNIAVVQLLAEMREVRERIEPAWPERYRAVPNAREFGYGEKDRAAMAEAEKALIAIGAVKAGNHWQFDYEPTEVLDQVVCSGCIPDQKSHQFYPTPQAVALFAVSAAQIEDSHSILEPSAGVGGISDLLPRLGTLCVEISSLHCKVLKAKGYEVVEADFLAWKPCRLFDRIVMNPPFSEGRWQAHLQAAADMLKPDGRLVAILPASAKGKDLLPGWSLEWARTFDNEFAGTSVSVVVLIAQRASAKDQLDIFQESKESA